MKQKIENNILLVIDMQNDFVNGCLSNKDTFNVLKPVCDKVINWVGKVIFTKDTHDKKKYLKTQEGTKLPVPHCLKGTHGHDLDFMLSDFECSDNVIEKHSFSSPEIGKYFYKLNKRRKIDSITLIGVCTDICVVSNALLLKAFLPETRIIVDSKCCAGTTMKNHTAALQTMECCQVEVI